MFDTTLLTTRLKNLSKAGLFNSKLVNTLKFPTAVKPRSSSPEDKAKAQRMSDALSFLFNEVKDAAEVCGIELAKAGGTWTWNSSSGNLYGPTVANHLGEAVIVWGRVMKPVVELQDDDHYLSIRELVQGRQYELVIMANNRQVAVPFWVKKGLNTTKALVLQKLQQKQLHTILDSAKVYQEPLIGLAKYKGQTLHVKSLVTQEPGQYGISGTIWFEEFPSVAFAANKKLVTSCLSGYESLVGSFEFEPGTLEFTVKGTNTKVISGVSQTWLEYEVLDTSVSVEDFFYEEDGLEALEATSYDEEVYGEEEEPLY